MHLGNLMVTVFMGPAGLKREYIRARQAEGIEVGKIEGKYKGRPAKVYDRRSLKKPLAYNC